MTANTSSVRSQDGIVATSHPLAAQAGVRVLERGGSAADAAVAAAAVLTVVDPRSTGLGGDLFALYWDAGDSRPVGLAAAGAAPAGLSVESLRAAGFTDMPGDGPWSVTVPGSVAGWDKLLERFGKLDRDAIFEPAVRYAQDGFAISPVVAHEWRDGAAKLRGNPAAAAMFLPGGRVPAPGQRFAVPELGRTLQRFVEEGPEPFYRGDLADSIAAAVRSAGGPLSALDLAEWPGPTWMAPISVKYSGLDVYEMPPPGQGVVVLEALRLYESLARGPAEEDDHAAIEALKLAFGDAARHVADPSVEDVPLAAMLSAEWLTAKRAEFRRDKASYGTVGRPSDTVFVAVAQQGRGACSLIQSVYESFGSGVGVPGTGIVLQNRASGFRLDANHPNRPAPRKRPYHTIIPAMLGEGAEFRGCLGVVGGYMQPQGQLQILRNVLARGMDPQAAIDAPRFRALKGRRLALEADYPRAIAEALAAKGHEIEPLSRKEAGGAQMILRIRDDLVGGSDSRKDGHAAAIAG